jgi:hypothetical protein
MVNHIFFKKVMPGSIDAIFRWYVLTRRKILKAPNSLM